MSHNDSFEFDAEDPAVTYGAETMTGGEAYAPAGENADSGKVYAVYALMLAGIVTGVTPIIGLIMAYVFRDTADDVAQSHYRNAIHIFWIGLLYSIISILLVMVVVGIPLLLVVGIWFIVRCAKGIHMMSQNRPYPNPSSWGF